MDLDSILTPGLEEDGDGTKRSWELAEGVVKEFPPVSWSGWRLLKFIFSRGAEIKTPPEGMLLGYQRILESIAADPVLGIEGDSVGLGTQLMSSLAADVVGAIVFIHSVSRRLQTRPHQKLWQTMLDDALLRARIGVLLGDANSEMGRGRCMLAGFSERIGMVVLIATGTQPQASQALQRLAQGATLSAVGRGVYGVDPFHLAAQLLMSAGIGIDCAQGVLAYIDPSSEPRSDVQLSWRAAMRIIEGARLVDLGGIDSADWLRFDIAAPEDREDFLSQVRQISRQGHRWEWVTAG